MKRKYEIEDYIQELDRELDMRKRVWPRYEGVEEHFKSWGHQRRYNLLKELKSVLQFYLSSVVESGNSQLKLF